MNQRWIIATPDPQAAETLANDLRLPLSLARVLVHRGFRDRDAASRFLDPRLQQLGNPFDLSDMAPAVDRILKALGDRERITVYGDYDVDGVTATALLLRVLRAAGASVDGFLPNRMDEGYGLSAAGVARCLQESSPQLLIAVDCGTSSADEIAGIQARGIDVIVLDHHEPPDRLPKCVALVNPKCRGGKIGRMDGWKAGSVAERDRPVIQLSNLPNFPSSNLPSVSPTPFASVGVVFKLAHALQKQGREQKLAWAEDLDLREHLDLVAVGTVADIVPLTGENRILVRAGLERLPGTTKPGLLALMNVAGVRGRVRPAHVGFRIGPRLNAAGRLGDARAALELLLTGDAERAAVLAKQLHECNAERQGVEERLVQEAMDRVRAEADLDRDRVLVLAGEGWHPGVIGIVASRLVQAFSRPVVVIGLENGLGKGSCRSIAGFSIVGALQQCASLLEGFGGHEMAAGLTIRAEQVDALRRALNESAAARLTDRDLVPSVTVDAVVKLDEFDAEFFRHLARFEPFGPENPHPVFAAQPVRVDGKPRVVGKNHLKFRVTDGETTVDAVWWGRGDERLPEGDLAVAFVPELNDFGGAESVQLRVRDVKGTG